MELKPGARLRSAVDTTEVVVVRAPSGDVDLRCGGHAMVALGTTPPEGLTAEAGGEGTQLGKRYADEEVGIELLCTKPGPGSMSIGESPLGLKDAKPLPSSD